MSLLNVKNLNVSYLTGRNATRVVHDVSFTIEPGEVLALVGESGSGKSTTAHALIGLLASNGKLESGKIELNGTDIAGWNDKRLQAVRGAQIGLIPQDPGSSLNPVRTIGSQLGEVLRIHRRESRSTVGARVHELLERVGLDNPSLRARQYPHELSGGMRQRVLIANAIALRPALVIADEATSALDATVQKTVLDLLDDLRTEYGTAVLFVTHDLGVAAERADSMVVMNHGRIEEAGPTSRILQSPGTPYSRMLISNAPALNPRSPRTHVTQVADEARKPAIEVTSLVREFPTGRRTEPFRAVDEVSFTVARGTTHSIVGESGSGKTTTARMILGLTTPSSGSVKIDGEETTELRGEALRLQRRRIQLVQQNPFASLDPRQGIGSIIREPMRNFSLGTPAEQQDAVLDLLDRVALPRTILERKPRELSGGQRQRVALARALAPQPAILVLDEAVSALDVTVQAQVLDLLVSLQDELGLSYLFISHDLAVVRQISHTVSVMRRGKVVESGNAADIFDNPGTEYTRNLLAAIPSPATAPAPDFERSLA
ncbi:dipeptide ABC transporter ATP-binding protein [Paeniglutamicibacter sp. NPDC091659]|uniref:dipeptide ABC transporter ATP-binding protein n=1 Tax=Paeniglutamicibacter sp. NPDC091659 TaxID=3364389 RepID=UPI003808E509